MGAWQITIKDLLLLLKDKGAFFTLLALPIVVIAILGMSTGKLLTGTKDTKLVRITVVDESHGEVSEHVIQDLSKINGITISRADNREVANSDLQKGVSTVLVLLGKEFDERIEDLDTADVLDPEHGKLAEGLQSIDASVESSGQFVGVGDLVQYVVLSAVLRAVAPEVLKRNRIFSNIMNRILEQHAQEISSPNGKEKTQAKTVSQELYETLVPSFLVMFAFFLVNIMASSFIVEREFGTLRRLRMSRVSPVQILAGKTLPFLFVSIVQSLLMFLAGMLLFGMSLGKNPMMLLPVIFATSLSVTGMGLLVATVVRTESQVSSYSTFLVVVLAGISGCYMPRAWLPQLMQTISLGTPHAWALIAYQELLTHDVPNLPLVVECCAILAAMGVIFFSFGAIRFRYSDCGP